jgi:hypothetical protein
MDLKYLHTRAEEQLAPSKKLLERELQELEDNKYPRTPQGTINNCALANGDAEVNCQVCRGSCPDRGRL